MRVRHKLNPAISIRSSIDRILNKNRNRSSARIAQFKVARKPVYFAIDQKLARRHKTLLFLAGFGQAAAILAVVISGIVPNIGNKAYAASGAYAGPHGSSVFVMLVKTDNAGSSNDTQFGIPVAGGTYNYRVDCDDDGTWDATGITGSYTCNYNAPGTYSVVIDGTISGVGFSGVTDRLKLLEIQQWGNIHWLTVANAFYNTSNMQITATDSPDLSGVTSTSGMFYGATNMNANLNNWDVSTITNMNSMFRYASSFNQPIGSWNTANVTDFSFMFGNSTFNQPIGSWNTSSANTMSHMFVDNADFNQPINSWNVGNVTSMYRMFWSADSFNQDLNSWNTGSVTNFEGMFGLGATAFNGDITSWDTSSALTMNSMFMGASSFNQPIIGWDVSSLINTVSMFQNATAFNQPLNNWNVSSVYNMEGMFKGAASFNQPLNSWNTSSLTDARWLFQNASSFNRPLNNWNVTGISDMYQMFAGATAFNETIDTWDVSHATIMVGMFQGATSFNQPIGNWDVSNVTNMSGMFSNATAFNQPLNDWNTSSATSISAMFYEASSFDQDLSGWDTSNVTNMSFMFQGAASFNRSLSNWNVSNVTMMDWMFLGSSFNQNIGGWNMSNVASASFMLTNSGITIETYDQILSGWAAQTLQNNVVFGGGASYCAATADRQSIIDDFNWTINDSGRLCMPEIATGTVVSVGEDSAVLEVNIIDDGGGSVNSAGVQLGLDTNYGSTYYADSYTEGVRQVQISSGNLACETTYHYRAFIENGAGTAYGDDATFTTALCPPPPQPYDLRLRANLLSAEPVKAGNVVQYQLTANNSGPGSAAGVYFYINIPQETSYTDATFDLPDGLEASCQDTGPIQNAEGGGPLWDTYDGNLVLCIVESNQGLFESGDEITVTLTLSANTDFTVGSTVLRGLAFPGDDENEADMLTFFDAIGSGTPLYDIDINNIVNLVYGQGDSDGDGIYDNTENAAPNNGDANNDGTPDSAQSNVTSLVDPVTGKYAVLAVDASCEITNIAIRPESSNAAQDKSNDYPNGMMDFTLGCGTPGYTANISQHYYGTSKDGFSLRKYNPTTKTYSTVDSASISERTIDNQTVTTATYQVKDGSSLDLDGIEDGNIHDPAGLARKAGLAGTGQNMITALYAGFVLFTFAGGIYGLTKARSKAGVTYSVRR